MPRRRSFTWAAIFADLTPHSVPSTWTGHGQMYMWKCLCSACSCIQGHTWVWVMGFPNHSSCSFPKLLESQCPVPGSPWAEQGAASSCETGSQDVQSSREQGCPFVPLILSPPLPPPLQPPGFKVKFKDTL